MAESSASNVRRNLSSTTNDRVNKLISEHSPYLLQHARNPVDWYELNVLFVHLSRPVQFNVYYVILQVSVE